MRNVVAGALCCALLAIGSSALSSSSQDPQDPSAAASRWPQWRGPNGLGVVAQTGLPLSWSDTENVIWKAPIDGAGHSSPIVWDDRIFLTTAIEGKVVPGARAPVHMRDGWADENPDQREPYLHPDSVGSDRRHELVVLALEASSGEEIWRRVAYNGVMHDNRHRRASYASATPATDGERVYAWFGSQGLHAYDFSGELLWSYDPGDLPTWGLGHGASPVLYGDLVILLCDYDNGDGSFIVGLEKSTGREVWRQARSVRANWSTPLLAHADGRELWRTVGLIGNVIATPLASDRLAYLSIGYPNKVTKAIPLNAEGQLSDTEIAWQYGKGTSYVTSNLLLGDYIYLLADNGILTCLDAATGAVVYEGGRVPLPTRFVASPVAFGSNIVLSGQDGDMFVVRAGPEHEVLATNSMGESLWASPAIANGRMYVRGDRHLFAIGRR